MSKSLSNLLEQPEKAIAKVISELESKNGYPSHDVRAIADNIQRVRTKIAELNLDPDDTTAEELHHALLVKFENDARRFDEHFGLYGEAYDKKIKKAVELVSRNVELPERWALRNATAKQLLRQHPPKKLMKHLGYRSVDSLVKREDLAEIYLAIELFESESWNKAHFKLASQLDTTAFEMRPLKVQALTSRWGFWETEDIYVGSSDYGVLGLAPSRQANDMSLLALVILLLDEVGAKPSASLKLSPAAAWWSETDNLIANLDASPVSLNLKDASFSHQASATIGEHYRSSAQHHFWKDLLSRYTNQIPIQEDIMLPALNIQTPLNQPAFEYVEDL